MPYWASRSGCCDPLRHDLRAGFRAGGFVYGFALQEASLPFDTAGELARMVEDVYLPQLPPDECPYLNESTAELVAERVASATGSAARVLDGLPDRSDAWSMRGRNSSPWSKKRSTEVGRRSCSSRTCVRRCRS